MGPSFCRPAISLCNILSSKLSRDGSETRSLLCFKSVPQHIQCQRYAKRAAVGHLGRNTGRHRLSIFYKIHSGHTGIDAAKCHVAQNVYIYQTCRLSVAAKLLTRIHSSYGEISKSSTSSEWQNKSCTNS